MNLLFLLLSLVLLSVSSLAGTVKLAWDASPSTNVVGYFLYANTNMLTETNMAALVKVDTGTNLTATVESLQAGRWYFAATARDTNGIESVPSNVVAVEVPEPPSNMRTVILQYSATITNFQDAIFFKLRFP